VPDNLTRALKRLRNTLWNRTEQAYAARDSTGNTDNARMFAAGEAHATASPKWTFGTLRMNGITRSKGSSV
jgi:hypothetical protein